MAMDPFRTNVSVTGESRFKTLSPQQLEVLLLLCSGNSTQEVADAMKLSARTVDGHRHRIKQKLRIETIEKRGRFMILEGTPESDAA